MVAAVLGTLLAGKAYVPLDPQDPVRRWREVWDDAGASALYKTQDGVTTRGGDHTSPRAKRPHAAR